MLGRASQGARVLNPDNVDLRQSFAETLLLEDPSVDVVISNGVINLIPDKAAVIVEVHRVLKLGDRVQIADIVIHQEVPQAVRDDIELWSG